MITTAPLDILVASFPFAGHVAPALPIVRALTGRGHRVRWYTGKQFADAVEGAGAVYEHMRSAPDPADHPLPDRFPEGRDLEGLKGFRFAMINHILGDAAEHVADLSTILDRNPADMLLADTGFLAAGMLRELGGPPLIGYGITALTLASRDTAPFGTGLAPGSGGLSRMRNRVLNQLTKHVLFRPIQAKHLQVRAALGLPPTSATIFEGVHLSELYVQGSNPSFEYPRNDLPEQVHFVGPLLAKAPPGFQPPTWWDRLAGQPVVLVTQGTFATDDAELIRPAIEGLADEPVLVVVAGAVDQSVVLPANVVAERFVPFAALMPHVDVMVTNGGFGGVQYALTNGVPLVASGTTEEKPEIAARIAWSGAGINLGKRSPTPHDVRAAVKRVLNDPSYRGNAERIAAETPADPAELAADLVVELGRNIRRKSPVALPRR